MKKYIITLLIVLAFFTNPSSSKAAEVRWDGAQVVTGQTGKMTFTKDVKVYKKNANGTYSSMTVKRNNYFRVYDIEKYDNKTFYWMSSGYRVQATDLVVFKKVPLNIRASLYDNPAYININRQGYSYGQHYRLDSALYNKISIGENLYYSYYDADGGSIEVNIDGSDIRIFETTKRDKGLYMLTADAQVSGGPMNGAGGIGRTKGTALHSLGLEINGYLWTNEGYIPVTLIQPVKKQGKRYIRYGVNAAAIKGNPKELKRFDEVILLTDNDTAAWIEVDGEEYSVPKKVLATIRPNESPIITTSFLPNDTIQQLVYQNYGTPIVYKKTTNNHFVAPALKYIDYSETEKNFTYNMDGFKYIFEKPVTEGSKVTRTGHGWNDEGFVRAIHYTITTPAGTFNNVVETSLNEFYAPGYGFISDDFGNKLTSYE
ncbi:hypothetical protein ACQKOF_19225 [Lysinibacillus sp. NPDC093190]|uniref:hypothetical protein n=1 Tax=Lysinibacillus sp. NPDC093190 TaxID=3390575 RepID=UPI003CFF487B